MPPTSWWPSWPSRSPRCSRAVSRVGVRPTSAHRWRPPSRAERGRQGRPCSPIGARTAGSDAAAPSPCRGDCRPRQVASGRRSRQPYRLAARQRAATTDTRDSGCGSCRTSGHGRRCRNAGSGMRCSRKIVRLFWRWSAPRSRSGYRHARCRVPFVLSRSGSALLRSRAARSEGRDSPPRSAITSSSCFTEMCWHSSDPDHDRVPRPLSPTALPR